ncbi:MAG: undecaprenyl/decaprenyl-phosphate alpha-N-acetylglucosaminyl 1-phosphate transferase, partial [Kiritimatiellae bacterium]|nr:undecaprenyl/decaprenyl-phosphate alpha-N-acetylglucosaminyl 1-phosphate transferase [Kiritimatiellia bacterium]
MNIFAKYFLVLFGAGVLTYVLTPLFRKFAWSIGLIAEPGGRRIHAKSTPLTGGIALFLGMHLACIPIFCCSYWGELDGHMNVHWWFVLLALSSVLLLLGILDDKLELRASIKFIGQVAVAVAAYFSGVHIGTLSGIELHPVLDMLLTVFWFVGFMNAFNLIDGMDGLAAGLGAIAATGMAAIFIYRGYPSNTLIMLALTGSCLAFLRYNFSPATIFLGDSGSMFIGFTLAFVALLTNSKSTTLAAIGIPMLAIGVPILDTLLAVWRRSIRARLSDGGDEGKISK